MFGIPIFGMERAGSVSFCYAMYISHRRMALFIQTPTFEREVCFVERVITTSSMAVPASSYQIVLHLHSLIDEL